MEIRYFLKFWHIGNIAKILFITEFENMQTIVIQALRSQDI